MSAVSSYLCTGQSTISPSVPTTRSWPSVLGHTTAASPSTASSSSSIWSRAWRCRCSPRSERCSPSDGKRAAFAPSCPRPPTRIPRSSLRSRSRVPPGPPSTQDASPSRIASSARARRRWSRASSRSVLQDLAAVTGLDYRPRRKVWAVERWGDDVLASLEGVSLERWDQDGGLRFRMTTEGVGCQLVTDDGVVLSNVEPPWGPPETGYRRSPSIVERIDPDSANVCSRLPVDAPTVLIRDRRGWLLARNCSLDRQAPRDSSCSRRHPISRRASPSADTTSSTTSCGSAMPPTC